MEKILEEIKNEVIEIRRKLHEIPEIGFNEVKTSKFIKDKLLEYGYKVEHVAKTGIVAIAKGTSNNAIAFRADMDGLNVREKTGVSFQSIHDDKMHACGHDGHMAILLGFAKYLSKAENIKRNIILIFQPAEEGPGGAEVIINEGVLNRYNVKEIFGLHIFPDIEEGKIGIASGPLMAQSGEVDIEIKGKSSHGAMPQQGIDGIHVSANLIQAYQSIISRNIDPNEGAVLTIGKILGGEARNVIAGNVIMEGTIRAFNSEVYNAIKERMKEINSGIEKMYNVEIKMVIRDFYPPVINDNKLFEIVKNSLSSEEFLEIKPMMLAEDFSYYQQEIPGLFFMLGSRNEELNYTYPLHSCYFNFNEEILINGVKTYIKIAKALEAL